MNKKQMKQKQTAEATLIFPHVWNKLDCMNWLCDRDDGSFGLLFHCHIGELTADFMGCDLLRWIVRLK